MSLFSPRKDLRVRNFVLKLVNNHCPDLMPRLEDLRDDKRVNLVVVVMIIPLKDGRPQVGQAFMAVTKDFSNDGVAVVLDQVYRLDQVMLGFQFQGERTFILAQAKHLDPMGGGFWQCGFQMTEIVSPGDYLELKSLSF